MITLIEVKSTDLRPIKLVVAHDDGHLARYAAATAWTRLNIFSDTAILFEQRQIDFRQTRPVENASAQVAVCPCGFERKSARVEPLIRFPVITPEVKFS